MKAVWNFILRDSIMDYISVTVWGSVSYIEGLTSFYHIGSVGECFWSLKNYNKTHIQSSNIIFVSIPVEVINGQVQLPDGKSEQFLPKTTSNLKIVINEGKALIQQYDGPDEVFYENLLITPAKSLSEVKTLKYVEDNKEDLKDQFVDIFVLVQFVSNIYAIQAFIENII